MSKFGFVKLLHVDPKPDYTLFLTFANGEKKVFDFKPKLDLKIYEPLKNPALFLRARSEAGGVVWNDDIDIAAEALYYNATSL